MSAGTRILLYNPPSDFYAMPLGLLAVGSAVHGSDGAEVQILDSSIDVWTDDRSGLAPGAGHQATPPEKSDSRMAHRFKGLQPSKMAAHPVPRRWSTKNCVFQQTASWLVE